MLIKVCGMREADNIRAVAALGVDMIGLIFWPHSPRYVSNIPVGAGIIPDRPSLPKPAGAVKTVGVFVDEMPQNVITAAYNYKLDYIQLHGTESPAYIDNLRRTLVPDIMPDVQFIKAISVREADDVKRWRPYADTADMLLFDTRCPCAGGSGRQFDWTMLDQYHGPLPFLLSGGIGPDDAERVLRFRHPQCVGIDLNSRFETEPAVKNIEALQTFINKIRQ